MTLVETVVADTCFLSPSSESFVNKLYLLVVCYNSTSSMQKQRDVAALSPEQRKLLLDFSKDGAIVACDWEQKVRLQHG